MLIDDARSRLAKLGVHVQIEPVPEWFRREITRLHREQDDRVRWDRMDLDAARQQRELTEQLRRLDPNAAARSASIHPASLATRQRYQRTVMATIHDPRAPMFERRVRALAAQLNVRIVWAPTAHAGTAWAEFGAVDIARPTNAMLAAVAGHELGHRAIRDRCKQFRRILSAEDPYQVICPLGEAAAWEWAKRECWGPSIWDAAMQCELRRALATYLQHAIPSETHVMRALMNQGPN